MLWARSNNRNGFATAVLEDNPDDDFQAILAVPLFHPREQDHPQPLPLGTIDVECFSSSSPASKVPRLLNEVLSLENQEIMAVQRGVLGILFIKCSDRLPEQLQPEQAKTEMLD